MGSSPVAPQLPPGFVIEQQPQQAAPPPIPPGFQVESAPQAQPSALGRFASGFYGETLKPIVDAGLGALQNPGGTLQGVGNFLKDPYTPTAEFAKNVLYDTPKRLIGEGVDAFKSGDVGTGLRKVGSSAIPMFGPSVDAAGQKMKEGDIAGGLGQTAGVAANLLGPKAVAEGAKAIEAGAKASGKATSRFLARTSLKPSKTIGRQKISAAIDQIIAEGTLPTDEGINAARANRKATGKAIGDEIISGPTPGLRNVSSQRIAQAIEEVKKDYTKSERAAIDTAADDVFDGLVQKDGSLRDMTAPEAHALKVKLQDAVNRANKQAWKPGVDVSARVETLQTAVGSLRDQLLEQFPELKGKNQQYAAQSDALRILEDAAGRIGNREPLGGIYSHVAAAVGGPKAWFTAKVLTDPILRMKLATKLGRASGIGTKVALERIKSVAPAPATNQSQSGGSSQSMGSSKAGAKFSSGIRGGGPNSPDVRGLLPEPEMIDVWHGTPHTFDKFDMSKVGTGEGAQAYGHGLYFAENQNVAKAYQDALTSTVPGRFKGGSKYQVKGAKFPDGRSGHAALDTAQDIDSLLAYRMMGAEDMASVVQSNIEHRINNWLERGTSTGSAGEDMSALVDYYVDHVRHATKNDIIEQHGNLYNVKLPKNANWLDWDKPLSEQPEVVQNIFRQLTNEDVGLGKNLSIRGEFDIRQNKYGDKKFYLVDNNGEWGSVPYDTAEAARRAGMSKIGSKIEGRTTGKELYEGLSPAWAGKDWHGSKGVSEELKSRGIPGIRYLDQGSRGSGSGTYNYVVFDDSLPQIVREGGLTRDAKTGRFVSENIEEQRIQDVITRQNAKP